VENLQSVAVTELSEDQARMDSNGLAAQIILHMELLFPKHLSTLGRKSQRKVEKMQEED
jgi:hypothetical protein